MEFLKQMVLALSELGVAQIALKMGRFGTKDGSKMGKNGFFFLSKIILDRLGCSKVTKCLEKGLFWDKK